LTQAGNHNSAITEKLLAAVNVTQSCSIIRINLFDSTQQIVFRSGSLILFNLMVLRNDYNILSNLQALPVTPALAVVSRKGLFGPPSRIPTDNHFIDNLVISHLESMSIGSTRKATRYQESTRVVALLYSSVSQFLPAIDTSFRTCSLPG
jgi:hypothetical protein